MSALFIGRVFYVGENDGAQSLVDKKTNVVDLKGNMMLPGFHDTHVHLISGGMQERKCTLNDLKTIDSVLIRIREYLQSTNPSPNKWIHCSGLDMTLSDQVTLEQLDGITRQHPLYIQTSDGHSMWVNSYAMALAGIIEGTPDPPHGEIVRFPGTQKPTGFLHDFATQMIKNVIPAASMEERIDGLKTGIEIANQYGITSIIEPILIVLLGLIVGTLVIVIYLPIFHLGSAMRQGI